LSRRESDFKVNSLTYASFLIMCYHILLLLEDNLEIANMELLNILYIVLIVVFILFIASFAALGLMVYRILKIIRDILAKFEDSLDNMDTIGEGLKLSFLKFIKGLFSKNTHKDD